MQRVMAGYYYLDNVPYLVGEGDEGAAAFNGFIPLRLLAVLAVPHNVFIPHKAITAHNLKLQAEFNELRYEAANAVLAIPSHIVPIQIIQRIVLLLYGCKAHIHTGGKRQ